MSAQVDASDFPADAAPARELIDALARAYPLLLTADAESGRIEWTSDGWTPALGGTPGLVGRRLRDVVAKLPRPEQSFPIATRLRECGAAHCASVELPTPDGTVAPFDVTMFHTQLADRESRLFAIARRGDKRATQRPAGSLIECLPDAVIAIDADGFVETANRNATGLLGTPAESLVGSAAVALAHDVEGMQQVLGSLRRSEPHEIHFRVRRDRGGALPVTARVAPHRGPGGEPRGVVLSLRDCAAERQATADLQRRNEELEHCVNSLAHDLRSPLVALLGFSRLLRQDYGERLDETGGHFVDRIEQAGHTMEALIHDLLELSRIGQPGEHAALIDPRSVLVQLAGEFKPRLEEDCIELRLPESPPLVYCDRTRLYQVFCNLIGNAIEHMGDGDVKRIEVSIASDAGLQRISVRDAGRGIAREHHERIFEAFQSLGARRDGRRGTGMGLAIVRKIAETRGGNAWVDSDVGHGATFHVTLPLP